MADMTDDILDDVNRKDMKAWEKLYAIYYAALCSYAENVLKDSDVAQDVVQDVLVKIWTSSLHFATIPELTAYLYRSVYNNSMCYLRTRQIRSRILREVPFERVELPDEHFARAVEEEVLRAVYLHIDELPDDRKKIMELTLKGYMGTEIAAMLDISINTVKTQKARSLKYLRDKLKGSVLLFLFF